jgi:nickel/cobalt transporter (NicO) family protein
MRRAILISLFAGLLILLPSQAALAHLGHGVLIQNLAQTTLSPSLMLTGMGVAFIAGAGHALTPGHGKTMVAAYLVGSQGTPQQAILLGLIATFTHTISVFGLGILVLLLSQYVLPEQMYSWLSLLSGLMVCGVGFTLLDRHLEHSSDHHHSHTHDHEHTHSHHIRESQTNLPSLLTLGVVGGLVPCPSALVLLLSAIALHHTTYGLMLVSAFSFGLAVVLTTIGLAVVYAHQWLGDLPLLQPLQRYVPIVSAIAVIATGTVLTACAVI